MRAIFISYRREDAEGQAGRLFDDLVIHFGEDAVFMDVAGIEPGRDFRRAIDEQVASCGVLLAVIGKNWFDAKDESGRHRLDDPMDFVRLETASALKRDIPVIPVLVRGASMPRVEQLPPDLAELAYRNAVELTHARWDSDVELLVKALRPHVELLQKDVGTEKTEPAAKAPGKKWTEGTVGASGKPGLTGTGPVLTARSARKSLLLIVAMSVAGIAVAVGGYIGYEKVVNVRPSVQATGFNDLSGIRLIYIQYRNDKDKAEKVQKYLQEKGISAPGIEQVQGISANDIRYFNTGDQTIAKKLKDNLEQSQNIKFDRLLNLSDAGYRVPAGQLEIWLRD
jgi:hypothetical protein